MNFESWKASDFLTQGHFEEQTGSPQGAFEFLPQSPYLASVLGIRGQTSESGEVTAVRLWFHKGCRDHGPVAEVVCKTTAALLNSFGVEIASDGQGMLDSHQLGTLLTSGATWKFDQGQVQFHDGQPDSVEFRWGKVKKERSFLGFKW